MDAKQLGVYGELAAARYLRKHGYVILEPNFRSRFGEIDLVAQMGDTVVFVEVKTRDAAAQIRPMEAVTPSKQQKIKKTSLLYLATLDKEVNVRYDVVEVLVSVRGIRRVKIHHIPNAFS